jgi:pyridoxine kinase
VIGNIDRGIFVRRGIPEFFKESLLPVADVVTPNQFELEYLAGRATATMTELAEAIDALHARGPRVVFVTSLHTSDTPSDHIDLVVSDGSDRCRLRMPQLPIVVNGAGDVAAALFLAHLLSTGSPVEAMALAASSIFGVLNRTAEAGASEMLLVEAQEELVNPSRMFVAQKI